MARRYAGPNGAKPEEALTILLEGSLIGKKFRGALDPALAAHGVTEKDWETVQQKLGKSWSAIGKCAQSFVDCRPAAHSTHHE